MGKGELVKGLFEIRIILKKASYLMVEARAV